MSTSSLVIIQLVVAFVTLAAAHINLRTAGLNLQRAHLEQARLQASAPPPFVLTPFETAVPLALPPKSKKRRKRSRR